MINIDPYRAYNIQDFTIEVNAQRNDMLNKEWAIVSIKKNYR